MGLRLLRRYVPPNFSAMLAHGTEGISFMGLFVGMILGITTDPLIWAPLRNKRVARQQAQGGDSEPEYRLPSTIAGAAVVPIALFGQSLQGYYIQHASNHD